jgi:hypothetical protein
MMLFTHKYIAIWMLKSFGIASHGLCILRQGDAAGSIAEELSQWHDVGTTFGRMLQAICTGLKGSGHL